MKKQGRSSKIQQVKSNCSNFIDKYSHRHVENEETPTKQDMQHLGLRERIRSKNVIIEEQEDYEEDQEASQEGFIF